MIGLEYVYALAGAMFTCFAIGHVHSIGGRRHWRSASFWGTYAVSFLCGSYLSDLANGLIAVLLIALAAGGLAPPYETTTIKERTAAAKRNRSRLFIPALTIPIVTVLGTLLANRVRIGNAPVFDPVHTTLIALACAVLMALATGIRLLHSNLLVCLREGRRLIDAVGWAAILPQMLAALGALFAVAGAGQVISYLFTGMVPIANGTSAVVAYTVGMAFFTIVMGSAFAAYPVMTAGIGLPLIVGRFGGDPVIMSALGMLSGFCGTLMTPMAANFNIVPAVLLELPDRYAVIKIQIPTALILLIANTALMAAFVFNRE